MKSRMGPERVQSETRTIEVLISTERTMRLLWTYGPWDYGPLD
jgi:hypothetical protein